MRQAFLELLIRCHDMMYNVQYVTELRVHVSVLTAGHCCYESARITVKLGRYLFNGPTEVDRFFTIFRFHEAIRHSMPPRYVFSRSSELQKMVLVSLDLCILTLLRTMQDIIPLPIGMLAVAETI